MPTLWAELSGNGNRFKTRWQLNKKEKYHPAQQSQTHTERLTLFSTPKLLVVDSLLRQFLLKKLLNLKYKKLLINEPKTYFFLAFHFDANLDPAFHFNADPDPAFLLMRNRIRILLLKMLRIHADPDPQNCREPQCAVAKNFGNLAVTSGNGNKICIQNCIFKGK